jgi:hypothetical protein
MTSIEGLLIVVIIILTILIFVKPAGKGKLQSMEWDCVNKSSGEVTNVKMNYKHGAGCGCARCSNPEKATQAEQLEYFSACKDASEMNKSLDCTGEDGDGKFSYAENDYGAPGLDYKSWVTSQAVDTAVLKNHSEFVKDRTGNNSINATGRTYAVPDDIEVDQIPWIGIRGRPQRVDVCNPTQVADVNIDYYPEKQKLRWG